MTFYGAIFWPSPETCLDDAFDEPDLAADAELCRAIAAGRWGLHPDGWGNHDPLPLRWLLRKRRVPLTEAFLPVDPDWEAKHRRRPVEPSPWKPKPRPKPRPPWPLAPDVPGGAWTANTPPAGTIELTCDECGVAFGRHLDYRGGQREAMAAGLRALGAQSGWTHIDGRDRCPGCSAPEDIGDGTGERDHDKQHANGG